VHSEYNPYEAGLGFAVEPIASPSLGPDYARDLQREFEEQEQQGRL